jgi:hypothetical protein
MKRNLTLFSLAAFGLLVSVASSHAATITISGNQILGGQSSSGELSGTSNSATALQIRNGYTLTVLSDATVDLQKAINISQGVDGDGASITQNAGSTVNVGTSMSMSGNATGGTSFYTMEGNSTLIISEDLDIGSEYDATFAIDNSSDGLATVSVGGNLNAEANSIFDFTLGATGFDAIDIDGTMTIVSGAELIIDGSSYTGGAGTISLFSYASLADETEFIETITGFGSLTADIVYTDTGIDLVLVPEPSTFALFGGLFVFASVVLRRRR